MAKTPTFATEAELVAAFCSTLEGSTGAVWTQYHESCGWDLLLAHENGVQVGIEAKLSLNAKVLEQALPGHWSEADGPDYRAVLVPQVGLQHHLTTIAEHLGIVIIRLGGSGSSFSGRHWFYTNPSLPDEAWDSCLRHWPNWCPSRRCILPDYVPDVTGGHAAPVTLTPWKIKAIKLLILLERNGCVTRADMKILGLSHSRWTDNYVGFLASDPIKGGYVRNGRTPDLKAQHPRNWPEIEADFASWSAGLSTPSMFEAAA